jgi:hypothetical protein
MPWVLVNARFKLKEHLRKIDPRTDPVQNKEFDSFMLTKDRINPSKTSAYYCALLSSRSTSATTVSMWIRTSTTIMFRFEEFYLH